MIMAEQDYCQYIISKCAAKVCTPATDGVFRTTKAFLESYENSSSFSVSARARDNRIIEWFSELIDETFQNSRDLDADCRRILSRCLRKVDAAKTYEELHTVFSDFLWVMASQKVTGCRMTSLVDDAVVERIKSAEWIADLHNKIQEAQYDLNCMLEADSLPLSKQILQGLISNPDVAKYVNRGYISYQDFKQRISDCQLYIKKKQQLYFAFMATTIYKEDMRRRYR